MTSIDIPAPMTHRRGRSHLAFTSCTLLVLGALLVGAAPSAAGGTSASRGPTRALPVTYFFVPSLHSRPFRIVPGPDGNMWFTDTDEALIGKITPSGQITEYPIGSGKHPYDLIAGSDGNIWFTEQFNNKIGAVDLAGNLIHEYYSPGSNSQPRGITVGPNGDIYWADGGDGQEVTDDVGRLLPDGTVVQYQLGPYVSFPTGITAGPDGNLWVAEELGVNPDVGDAPGTIDSVSPDGKTINLYPLPVPPFSEQHLPAWVAAGPDSRVWFTELNSSIHQIGAVSQSGTITEYSIPGAITNTGTITTGFDHNLWVTEPDANTVAVVRPDGSFVRDIPVHAEPVGITLGPDGNVWFANALSGEIGRISTARAGVSYVLHIAPGFVPAERTTDLGTTVQWVLEAPGAHMIADTTGLGVFQAHPRGPVSFLQHRFTAAGTYPYVDAKSGDAGSIEVPVNAPSTGTIGQRFTIAWATVAPPAGQVFDVEYLPPGSTSWLTLQIGSTAISAPFRPNAGGTYQFRSRLRTSDSTASTDWSPARSVVVS
jgi:streptogramin lyase